MALAMAMAQEQALSAATTSLPKNEDELKTTITGWFLSHGQAGGVALLVVLVAVVLLSQAQNIEAAKRLLGLERKPAEAPPEPVKAKGTSVEVSGTENITLTGLRAERDVVVNQTIHHHTQATPDPKVPLGGLTNLPPARPGFLARASELQTLATDLAPEGAQVVIHGLPGVGKTSLALHYAHTHGGAYPGGVWWLDARKEFDALALDAVTELEARIGLPREEGLNLEARLRRCFQSWPGQPEQPVLLVVDNLPPAPDGLKLLERLTTGLPGRFRRLLTQRALPPSGTPAVKLPVLAPDEALELLKARSGASGPERIAREEKQAQELVEEVGRLPLALVLLGGRLDRLLTLKVSDLRQELAQSALQAKAFTQQNADFQGEQGLVATLLTSWATLRPETKELARLLSLTLPAPIPWELIEPCAPAGPTTSPPSDTRHWDDALSELMGANLLDALAGDPPRYALHPLVRHFFSLQRQGWEREPHWRQELVTAAQALAKAFQGVDLPRSVDFWRQATHADPANIWAFFSLGYGLIPLGDTEGAKQAFAQCLQNAKAAKVERGESGAWTGIGDVLVSQGDGPGALAAFQAALSIAEGLAKCDPANTQWQRDLTVSNIKIGDVLVLQGDGPGALAAFQAALSIAEGLAKHDPANTEWQRDLFISQSKVADVLMAQGDGPAALKAYQAVLATNEGLAKRDPANTQWQVDVAVSCSKLGILKALLPVATRREYLVRGLHILQALKKAGRLHSNQDFTPWFEEEIRKLDSSG